MCEESRSMAARIRAKGNSTGFGTRYRPRKSVAEKVRLTFRVNRTCSSSEQMDITCWQGVAIAIRLHNDRLGKCEGSFSRNCSSGLPLLSGKFLTDWASNNLARYLQKAINCRQINLSMIFGRSDRNKESALLRLSGTVLQMTR